MHARRGRARWAERIARGGIEVAGIIFLFYANLLMGEFERSSRRGKTWAYAFADIFTEKNFAIAIVTAVAGYAVFEVLRRRLRK